MNKLDSKKYNKELKNLQVELIKLQEWIKQEALKVVVLFEEEMPLEKVELLRESLNLLIQEYVKWLR